MCLYIQLHHLLLLGFLVVLVCSLAPQSQLSQSLASFGDFSHQWKTRAKKLYPASSNDILGAFVDRGIELQPSRGMLGSITARTCFFLKTFQKWREQVVLVKSTPRLVADLGHGVMDDAMVEAAAYVLEKK